MSAALTVTDELKSPMADGRNDLMYSSAAGVLVEAASQFVHSFMERVRRIISSFDS